MLDIVLLISDSEKADKQIKSIMETQGYNDKKIKVYCMDQTGDWDNTKYISETESGRFVYYDVSDKSTAQILNYALDETTGDSITFQLNNGKYEFGALDKVLDFEKEKKIISFDPFYINDKGIKVGYSGFKKQYNADDKMFIDLKMFPDRFHIWFSAFVFDKSLFENRRFDESLPYDTEQKMLIELLDKEQEYLYLNSGYIISDPVENDFFNYAPQFDKSWYQETMDNFLINAVKKDSDEFVQRYVLYLIICRYACNMNERDKTILSPAESQEFFEKTGKALENISDVLIGGCNKLNGRTIIPRFFALNLLRMKYNDEKLMPELAVSGTEITAHCKGSQLWSLGGTKIEFKVLYFDGENLTMDGFFPGSYVFPEGDIEINAVLDQTKIYPVRRNHIYALNKFFNVSAKGNYSFQFSMSVSELKKVKNISFWLNYKGRNYPLGATFIRAQTKLSTVKNAYWICGNCILSYNGKQKSFIVEKLTRKSHFKHEINYIKAILKATHGMWKIKMVGNRLLYWASKPFFKKKIWLTMDKIFKAGDNGEYFYRYAMTRKPEDVDIYYVVAENSPDYKRLKSEYKTIVKFNTIKHKMLALHTDLMLATHVDTMNCNGYYAATQKYFKDLYNARVVCLAHGLTIQRIAQYQNRVFDNTVLYFFASKYEVENVSHEVYDYYDKNALCLTGHARYDGLVSNDKKIILITPTWRRGITTGKANKGSTYAHSSSFIHSDYYHIYNGLINDSRLIATAKEQGYRIVYLLHPAMSSQLEDFEKSEGVEIVAATSDISYEKILTESSLMVTDYSGVQFDFAYMKKPVVYYHPDILPPQYEAGGLVYETMGFGPICRNHEQIVESLCSYMKRSCEMEDEYKKRVDDFFAYSDHNNCERIYEEVIKFQNKFDKVNKHKY